MGVVLSLGLPLLPAGHPYAGNFAYAKVYKDGVTSVSQSFNPNTDHTVTSTKISTGRYSVVFKNLYTHSYDPGYFADPGFLNNVIVQKTCDGDSAASCRRSVCIPYSWAPGHFVPSPTGNVYDSTLEVRCYGPDGNARDIFRAFAGEESQVSQGDYSDFNSAGRHFGWINYVSQSSNVCHDPSAFVHLAQHESAYDGEFNETMQLCKTGTGRYTVTPKGNVGLYHEDDLIPAVSSKSTGGTYCNVYQVFRNHGFGATDYDNVKVRCYDRTGAAVNSSWNLSFFY